MSGRTVSALSGLHAQANTGKWTRVYWPPRVDSIIWLFIEVREKSQADCAKGYWPAKSFWGMPDQPNKWVCSLNGVHSKVSEASVSDLSSTRSHCVTPCWTSHESGTQAHTRFEKMAHKNSQMQNDALCACLCLGEILFVCTVWTVWDMTKPDELMQHQVCYERLRKACVGARSVYTGPICSLSPLLFLFSVGVVLKAGLRGELASLW